MIFLTLVGDRRRGAAVLAAGQVLDLAGHRSCSLPIMTLKAAIEPTIWLVGVTRGG